MQNNSTLSRELMEFLYGLESIRAIAGSNRVNSIMLFKNFLEWEDSVLYDYLFDFEITEYEFINSEMEEAIAMFVEEDKEKPIEEDKENSFVYFEYGDAIEKIYFTEDAGKILYTMMQIDYESYTILDFLQALMKKMPKDLMKLLRCLEINVKDMKETILSLNVISMPIELKGFVKLLNDDYPKGTTQTILGRDKETKSIWATLQKKTKRNVVLTGEPGVGKTAIVKRLAIDIANGECPEEFKNKRIISVNVNSAVAGTKYRGQAEEKFDSLIRYLEENNDIILFIDEIHLILGAGAGLEGGLDLANALKPILAEDKVRVIGATTQDEYEKYFSKDGALKRRFREVVVKEPKAENVYPMLRKSISELSKYHGVKITKSMVEYIIFVSGCMNYETKNPDRTKDLIDLSMVTAKNSGKEYVDKEAVMEIYEDNLENYRRIPHSEKIATAYHEAGHYLVWKLSNRLNNIRALAVSIIPTDEYLGVNVFEDVEYPTTSRDMDYFLESIALDLGGRVAEKLINQSINAGASADLEVATKAAYKVVNKYGMSNINQNIAIINGDGYSMHTQKTIEESNNEIQKIIDDAYKRAEGIILANKPLLKKIVKKLMKDGMVSEKELDKICKQHMKVIV